MYDFHIHSRVSFDGHHTGEALAQVALKKGLKEICFTDHLDYDPLGTFPNIAFSLEDYRREYDGLEVPGIIIRRGMEFGMTPDNLSQFQKDVSKRNYDFVLGSIHFVDGLDVYFQEFWEGKTVFEAERRYLEDTLACVQVHGDYDVLAHLSYIAKTRANPAPRPVPYGEHREIIDEILRVLVRKGKGLEMNTSGVDRCGGYLPTADILTRFKELGGQIVTIGSDAHDCSRVGQYCGEACEILKDIFGYVCTFAERKPVFHKL